MTELRDENALWPAPATDGPRPSFRRAPTTRLEEPSPPPERKSRRVYAALSVLSLVGLSAALVAHHAFQRPRGHEPAKAAVPAEDHPVALEPAARIASLQPPRPAPRLHASAAVPPPSPPPDEPQAEPTHPHLDSPEAFQEHVETNFAAEQVDRAWAIVAETQLSASIEKILPKGSQVRSTKCHQTICRVDLEHRDALAPGALLRLLPQGRPWNAAVYLTPPVAEVGDTVKSHFFIARQGYPLEGIAD